MIDAHGRYLRVAVWLRNRYTKNGVLVLSDSGEPTRYSRLQDLAWRRLLRDRDTAPQAQS